MMAHLAPVNFTFRRYRGLIAIFCQSDIDRFKQTDHTYSKVFADYLQARFSELKKCLSGDEEKEFNLQKFGYMVILEKSDDLRNLSEAGLNICDNGLFGDVPEKVCLIEIPGFSFYEIQTVYNNDYTMQFYLAAGEFEDLYPEFKAYLKRWIHGKCSFKPEKNKQGFKI